MYISKLSIKNFRILQDNCIEFNERINVIIGPNNCGKSTILTALRLLFDNNMKKQLSIDDFNKNSSFQNYKDAPPMIMISAILTHELKQDEELSNEVIPIGLSVDDVVFVCSKDVQSIVLRCGATDAGSYLVSDDHSQTEYVFDDGTLMVVSGNTCTVGRTLDVAQIVGVGERRGCL